jgi:hypothetical protein
MCCVHQDFLLSKWHNITWTIGFLGGEIGGVRVVGIYVELQIHVDTIVYESVILIIERFC